MNILIQHTFNTGLGDCIVAVSEYVHNCLKLKDEGYKIHLKVNTSDNKYYKDLKLTDLFDESVFNIFDTVEYISNSFIIPPDNYEVKHISYNAPKPGLHWWDLFVEKNDNFDFDVTTFFQQPTTFANVQYAPILQLSHEVINIVEELNYTNESSIYLRSNDEVETLELYEIYKDIINDIVKTSSSIFVCSNSYTLKEKIKQIADNNLIYYNIPYEDNVQFSGTPLGNHFSSKYCSNVPLDIRKKRTLYTMAEMVKLSKSKTIHYFTSWNRISNFLFLSIANNTEVIFYNRP